MTSVHSDTQNPQGDISQADARALLRDHFLENSGEKYKEGWSKLWDRGDLLLWDRKVPSPALVDTLDNWKHVVGTSKLILPDGTTRRKRAFVPGCGRGVDVMLLQAYGYDVVGLDVSDTAVEEAERYANENDSLELYKARNESGKGSRKFVQGDFFADDWLQKAGLTAEENGVFELIYDYTFFCAMHPEKRPLWAQRQAQLLSRTAQANLICLEFPTNKDPATGGPPYAAPSQAYLEHLNHPGEDVAYDAEGRLKVNPFAESSPGGLERVGYWHPADTHGVGKDEEGNVMDYISVWRHR